ncbi:MAG: hypothetical protein ABI627_20060 [Polyangiaceae bacterium]
MLRSALMGCCSDPSGEAFPFDIPLRLDATSVPPPCSIMCACLYWLGRPLLLAREAYRERLSGSLGAAAAGKIYLGLMPHTLCITIGRNRSASYRGNRQSRRE